MYSPLIFISGDSIGSSAGINSMGGIKFGCAKLASASKFCVCGISVPEPSSFWSGAIGETVVVAGGGSVVVDDDDVDTKFGGFCGAAVDAVKSCSIKIECYKMNIENYRFECG